MDNPTYACDECQCPTELTALLRFGKEHVCRLCHSMRQAPPSVEAEQRTAETLRLMAGYDAHEVGE